MRKTSCYPFRRIIKSDVIEASNSTSRYLDDILNIDNNFFDSMVNRIYLSELQLNKANVSDAEASFLDLHLSISDAKGKGYVLTVNCGQPKHSAAETDCKHPAKCINCKEDHPANSKQCEAGTLKKMVGWLFWV